MFARFALGWMAALTLAVTAGGADLKRAVSDGVRQLRAAQNDDGSFGLEDEQPGTTARVLQVLGRCGDHFTTQDGPFMRKAVDFVVARQAQDGGFGSMEAGDRYLVTKDVLAALDLVARAPAYSKARTKAQAFLDAAHPTRKDADAAVDLALGGLGGGASVDELAAAAKDTVTPDSTADAADRLLALLHAIDVEEAHAAPPAPAAQADAQAPADEIAKRAPPKDAAETQARLRDSLRWLAGQQHDGRFGMGEAADAGITAIALSAVIRTCDALGEAHPDWVGKGLDYLAGLQKEDGGIYDLGLKNYVTSVSVEALSVSGDAKYHDVITRGVDFLVSTQFDEQAGFSAEEDPYYGGFGYGSSDKPDLSNTQMAIQALHEAGVPPDHEAYKKAVEFLRRCQNAKESGAPPITRTDGTVVVPGDDGGAIYRPGDSKAGEAKNPDGTVSPRSYGSMTYALLKSYLFAGLDPQDAKVQAAVDWIRGHYTLEVNPGFDRGRGAEYQGLFYYYLSLARALNALGGDALTGPDGAAHDWKSDLRTQLFSLQAEDGHWLNQRSSRWMEGNPVLTTSYALLALAETR